jgi:protein-disulfide reductase (glutathione)
VRAWVLALALMGADPAVAEDWNDAQVAWRGYAEGLAEARREGKPICLVFYADWCKGCQAYRKLFFDPKVVTMTRDLVMVRVNRDHAPELSAKYAVDGEYIPRTYFLSSDGVLDPEIRRLGQDQAYYYDVTATSPLRSGMKWALKRFQRAARAQSK